MYKIPIVNNYKPDLLGHQLYFIQRWGELFENGSLNYRKQIRPCLRSILKESIQVIDYYKNQALYEHNIFEIFEEVIGALKANKVIGSYFKEDWALVTGRVVNFIANRSTFEAIKEEINKYHLLDLPYTLIKALLNKLENEDIPKLYSEYFGIELLKTSLSFEIVDELLELLAGELIYEGHHKQYLYNWGNGVFLKDSEPNFFKKIERISSLGKKNKRYFECLIRLKLPDKCEIPFENPEGRIVFYNDIERLRIKFGEQYSIEKELDGVASEFFKTEKQIARISMCATDEVAAVNVARQELISTMKLFTLENKYKQYEPGSLPEAIIFDSTGRNLELKPKIESVVQGLQISNNEQYIRINLSAKLSAKYIGLNQLLQWCRVIQDSPKETGLVAMWSLLEFLFVLEANSNKRQGILEYAIPYISQFYFKSLAWRTRDLLKLHLAENQCLLEKIESLYGSESIDNARKEAKLHYLIKYITEKKIEVYNVYSAKLLEQRYIRLIYKLMQLRGNKLWLSSYIENLEKRIKSDFLRAYRLRNVIAHQATINKEALNDIYDVITFYLKLILDDLLYSMKLQPENSVHDMVKIRKESYHDYLKNLTNINSISDIPYRKLLNTKSLLT